MFIKSYQSVFWWTIICSAMLVALLVNINFALYPVAPGLDPSWLETISSAQAQGYKFGDDISFTVGPLQNVLYSRFQGDYSSTVIVFKLIYAVSIFFAFTLAFEPYWKIPFFFCIATIILPINSDVVCLIYILSCYFCLTRTPGIKNTFTFLLLVGLSIICLAKFSNILPTAAIVILSDIARGIKRKIPFATVAFVVLMLACAASIGVYPAEVIAYLKSGWLVASGYSEAMNIFGSRIEVLAWLLLAFYLALTTLFISARSEIQNLPVSAINWLAISCILFMSFKHGFVRHDAHSLIAWMALVLIYIFVLFGLSTRGSSVKPVTYIAFGAVVVFALIQSSNLQGWSRAAAWGRIYSARHEVSALYKFAFSNSEWMKELLAADSVAREQIAKDSPFPKFPGTVDMMVNEQSTLLAGGAQLTPRPSIQEHGAYSPELVRRNGAFFLGPKAPEFFLFGLGTIDMRHPAFSEGPQWLTFLSRYQPVSYIRDMVVLKRKPQPSPVTLSNEVLSSVGIGEKSVPPAGGAYFVKIKLSKTLVGRLMSFAFKTPLVYLRTSYADGTQTTFRLIPGMAEEGAILIPTISNNRDFSLLYLGDKGVERLKQPSSFEVLTGRLGRMAYNNDVSISFSKIDLGRIELSEQSKNFVRETYESNESLRSIFELNAENPPTLMRSAEGIFAHAPSSLRYEVSGIKVLDLEFGLRDDSWSSGRDTDGACFSVRSVVDVLSERCLDPKQNPQDRGPQRMTVKIPYNIKEVFLETRCRASCAWDWSYWSKVTRR